MTTNAQDALTFSCWNCQHRHSVKEIESWEMPWISWWEHSCAKRPGMGNLIQFPFRNTMCDKHQQKSSKEVPA